MTCPSYKYLLLFWIHEVFCVLITTEFCVFPIPSYFYELLFRLHNGLPDPIGIIHGQNKGQLGGTWYLQIDVCGTRWEISRSRWSQQLGCCQVRPSYHSIACQHKTDVYLSSGSQENNDPKQQWQIAYAGKMNLKGDSKEAFVTEFFLINVKTGSYLIDGTSQ